MENKNKIKKSFSKIVSIFVLVFLLGAIFDIPVANAATLYFSPTSGSYNVGNSFSLNIYASSANQSMNAASGIIGFPADKLEVTSVSIGGSIIDLWVQQPAYSNSAGTVSFEGIVLNPGWQGGNGKVISVAFRTKATGTANLTFASGSILANDGQGTNILSGLGSARIDIEVPVTGPGAEESETPPAVVVGTPPAPRISSDTHPDSDSWYPNSIPSFYWNLPSGTTAAQLLVGTKPQASPTVNYSPAISSRQLDKLDDGIWYFHVRLRNANGWGGITHFRFQIDSQDPEFFNIEQLPESDPTSPTRSFKFEASDVTSGIDHYEIQIDGDEPQDWIDEGNGIYETSALHPGKHNLIIKAVDGAGNFLTNVAEFFVDSIDSPVITEYPQELQSKEAFIVRGTTYSAAQIILSLQSEKGDTQTYVTTADHNGNFTYIHEDKLRDGVYTMWAEAVDQRGARSNPTQKYTIVVQQPHWWKIGTLTANILSVIIPLLALIFFLAFGLWFSWHKFMKMRKRVRKEVGEAEDVLSQSFDALRKSVASRINTLEKTGKRRKLTAAETRLIRQLKKDLTAAEKSVRKEIKDIARQVK